MLLLLLPAFLLCGLLRCRLLCSFALFRHRYHLLSECKIVHRDIGLSKQFSQRIPAEGCAEGCPTTPRTGRFSIAMRSATHDGTRSLSFSTSTRRLARAWRARKDAAPPPAPAQSSNRVPWHTNRTLRKTRASSRARAVDISELAEKQGEKRNLGDTAPPHGPTPCAASALADAPPLAARVDAPASPPVDARASSIQGTTWADTSIVPAFPVTGSHVRTRKVARGKPPERGSRRGQKKF